ncbi:putative Josephin [Blattamonas nauphoetae]|uniref:ubiquitinyl hydrolase 1 n=1 Tax=Blattamonas nauphoetae TaxID=2049346 RepID=A0ABQ9XMG1_9EUKA|nr:putative Josephin [Blattamonas nauphoetae]
MTDPPLSSDQIYVFHDKQHLKLCAVHTFNNLLQRRIVTRSDFDEIASTFSDVQSRWQRLFLHKTPLLGNYDADTVQYALHAASIPYTFFPHTSRYMTPEDLMDKCGIVINRAGSLTKGNHWFCIRRINTKWRNLDSLRDCPSSYFTDQACCNFVNLTVSEAPDQCLIILICCGEFELDTISHFFYSNFALQDRRIKEDPEQMNAYFDQKPWTFLQRAAIVTKKMEEMRKRWAAESLNELEITRSEHVKTEIGEEESLKPTEQQEMDEPEDIPKINPSTDSISDSAFGEYCSRHLREENERQLKRFIQQAKEESENEKMKLEDPRESTIH